jgi:hypothetical protein
MTRTIFYSWQSDLLAKYNRNFIGSTLQKAIKASNKSEDYNLYHEIDRDTKGKEGSPDIVDTIFEKISNSEIFVCDISIINSGSSHRKTPNPNVLTELGFAAATLGWDNIICVFNEAHGEIAELPFDIRHRRIMSYFLDEYSNISETRKKLKELFTIAIQSIDSQELQYKRKILRAYRDESTLARKLALSKPENWRLMLTDELLTYRLEKALIRLDQIDNGTVHIPRRKRSTSEIFKFLVELNTNAMSLIKSVQTVIESSWARTVNAKTHTNQELLLLDTIKLIEELLYMILDWEIEIKSLIPPKEIQDDLEKMSMALRPTVRQFEDFLTAIRDIYQNKPSQSEITTTLNLQEEYVSSFHKVLKYFNRLAEAGQLKID